jgi:hypothetical protein
LPGGILQALLVFGYIQKELVRIFGLQGLEFFEGY